ncbi:MAG: hypothetical protein Q9162_002183 [Coniocarpon cinnabarinum]
MCDVEKDAQAGPLEGIAAFSALLASDPSLQVYRSFRELTARNLVCMQSELFELEDKLKALDEDDRRLIELGSEDAADARQAAKSWTFALQTGRDKERVKITRQIRSLLADYQDALLRQSQVLALERPAKPVRVSLRDWVAQEFPFIGRESTLFQRYEQDMVALRVPPEEDRLTAFLTPLLGRVLRKSGKHDHSSREAGPVIGYYSETVTRHVVSTVSALIAAALLIGAIVALYEVQTAGVKLLLVAVFTMIFAASVGVLTGARRAEIYASTAAYAAVLVVFISGNIQDG